MSVSMWLLVLTAGLLAGVLITVYLVFRLIFLLTLIKDGRTSDTFLQPQRKKNIKTLAVVGSGGHTTEILRLMAALQACYKPRIYVVANTDQISKNKIHTAEQARHHGSGTDEYKIIEVPRSREVKQSWITTVFSTLYATLYSFPLVLWSRPDLILCNGPGTCIPICYLAFFLRALGWKDTRIVYVESICRVETLSMSGRLLYYIVDHMIVQWPQLKEKYPLARYMGRVV